MNKLILLCGTLLFSFAGNAAAQTTWYVPDDFPTIQSGIDGSSNGDTVIVRDGIYFENINLNGKAITLESENGPATTTIDGRALLAVVTVSSGETYSTCIDGFTVRNGRAWDGGGFRIESSSPHIKNCLIKDNFADGGGGGMFLGGFFSGTTRIEKCSFVQNTVDIYHGGAVVMFGEAAVTFANCTFWGNLSNGSDTSGIALWDQANVLNIENCILDNNQRNISPINAGGLATINISYSLLKGDTGEPWFTSSCIDTDPMLGSPPLDLRPQWGSPCIDAGNPSSPFDPDGTVSDIGAFFFDQSPPFLSVFNLIAGQTAEIRVIRNTPQKKAFFAYSLAGGGPTNSPWGTLLLDFPYFALPSVQADSWGEATVYQGIPAGASGISVWIQAYDPGTRRLSNGLALQVQ